MPYRDSRFEAPKAKPEAGIVDDMVRQFADPYAFLRELVQNGIDAGAKTLAVRIERDIDGSVRTSIEDDGKGMSRAVIDGPLLTLFESSKESDETKIGKYGVGFVSVFALDPTRVEVRTRTGREAWLLRLFRDYSFELEVDQAPREGSGTIVTLVHAISDFDEHVTKAEHALRRWCRHARIPIELYVLDATSPTDPKPTTINEPFALEADVFVEDEREGFRILVGANAKNASFCGYYNRGLTLYETIQPEPYLTGICFKIESAKLAHTLSRDNIRRDAALERALVHVRGMVMGPLWKGIEQRVLEAAAASDPARLSVLYASASAHAFDRPFGPLAAPLTDRIDGLTAMPLERITKATGGILIADEPSPLTRALAQRKVPVVRHVALAETLGSARVGFGVRLVHEAFCFTEARDDGDGELLDAMAALLAIVRRRVGRVRFATFSGANAKDFVRVVDTDKDFAVSPPGVRPDWSSSSVLFLNGDHVLVRIARKRARTDVSIAAHVLCRAILLGEGPIAEKDVDRLLEAPT